MQTENAQNAKPTREVVFDDQGQTVEVHDAVDEVAEAAREAGAPDSGDETPAAPAAKFRIGNREFATQDEALAFAQSHVTTLETETQVADAYRQGIRDAIAQAPAAATGVTPAAAAPADDLDTQELYTNPQEFLNKYAQKIKTEMLSEVNQQQTLKQQSDQIWNEFSGRHPELADFRNEIEQFASTNQNEVRAIIQTKGRPAAYDYVATKIKSRFESYANALKPKRELSNSGGGASPAQKSVGVTPKVPEKKALSFSDQIRNIRKGRK